MSVNVKCELSPKARIEDVAKVLAALIGHPKAHSPIEGSDATFSRVAGYAFRSTLSANPASGYIVLDASINTPAARLLAESDSEKYSLLYSWDYSKEGGLSFRPAATPVKIALCARLVGFFGGVVDFNDSDESPFDLEIEPREDIRASDDPLWSQRENRILAIEPLTEEEIARYEKWATYQVPTAA